MCKLFYSNAYVSDEIITSRAGVRIRVGNTDAEGRMAMVDVLAHMKEKALNEVNPHLFTIATLTGKYGQSCSGLQRIFSMVAHAVALGLTRCKNNVSVVRR